MPSHSRYSGPNVAKVCFHSPHAPSPSPSGSTENLFFRNANAFRCSNVHYDLLTCFVDYYYYIGTFQTIYSRIIFRIKTHRIRMSHTCRPYISHKLQLLAFLPASRYAKDPIFNIVLTKRSTHDLSDWGDARPAMKTVVWRATGFSTTPDLRRGDNMV